MTELEQLRDRVQQLEDALRIQLPLPNAMGLTKAETEVLGVLMRRDIANKDVIFSALYASRPESDQPEINIINVLIHHLRRKGVPIRNSYGMGYYIDPDKKDEIRNGLIDE